MKRAAIIFLALFVWLCLAPGAFAQELTGEYMVIYINVESGNIAWVSGADVLPIFPEGSVTTDVQVKKTKYHTNNGNPNGKPIKIVDEISRTTYTTFFAAESPGCRYIWFNGRYVKVCN